jgi:hypothetical protein
VSAFPALALADILGTLSAWPSSQAHAQTLPNLPTKEDLAQDNNLFLSLARKALKWDEPADRRSPLFRRHPTPRVFREDRPQRAFAEQSYREAKRGRIVDGTVRRLPEGYAEQPSDHGGLELHRETLPTAQGNHRRHLEIPRGAAAKLTAASEKVRPRAPTTFLDLDQRQKPAVQRCWQRADVRQTSKLFSTMPQDDEPTSRRKPPSKPSRTQEALRVAEEYAEDLREILKKLRKLFH